MAPGVGHALVEPAPAPVPFALHARVIAARRKAAVLIFPLRDRALIVPARLPDLRASGRRDGRRPLATDEPFLTLARSRRSLAAMPTSKTAVAARTAGVPLALALSEAHDWCESALFQGGRLSELLENQVAFDHANAMAAEWRALKAANVLPGGARVEVIESYFFLASIKHLLVWLGHLTRHGNRPAKEIVQATKDFSAARPAPGRFARPARAPVHDGGLGPARAQPAGTRGPRAQGCARARLQDGGRNQPAGVHGGAPGALSRSRGGPPEARVAQRFTRAARQSSR